MLDKLSNKFSEIVQYIGGKAHISEKNIREAIDEIKMALLEADVNVRVVRRFTNHTIEEALGEKVLKSVSPGQQFVKIVHDRIVKLFGEEKAELNLKGPDTQSVILLLGLQGSGKTTTAAKLAHLLKKTRNKILLIAADLIRPAAVEQLSILAGKAGVECYKEQGANDPVKLVKNGLKYAKKNLFDTVIIDTSGRLQIDDPLMQQIESIKKASDPDETILVADAMTGQNAVDIAKEFNERLEISGLILSKFDSDTRGGAALSIKSITGKPIKFIGTGEKIDSLEIFYPERMASRILGMGDVVSLVEKAQETFDVKEAEKLQKKIESKNFTLEDMLAQFQQVTKMGNIKSLMEMIPGLKGNMPENVDTKDMKKKEAIILSMTKNERKNHRIIGPSRRKRIAKGSGTAVFEVNKLLKQFEKTRLMMKKMVKNKNYQSKMLSQFGV
jgi:signal recognition particle subunit SRP54